MEYEKIKDWLDKLVDNHKELKSLEDYNNQICLAAVAYFIQIYSGIQMIADVMGFVLNEEERECTGYPYEYSFYYRGIKFLQINKEKLNA